ncbi:MAG: hypothetical protein PHF56_03250 [Desulfuromonadaceae bacterium]|nr:hypothetical protein [Desulfuromonadaceae bacterium]
MKAFINLIAVVVFSFILTACVGDSSANKTATVPVSPSATTPEDLTQKINLKAAIYQTFSSHPGFPSGKLTLTTDSVGTEVYGKYSVIKNGTLVSYGSVSGSTSKLFLFSSYTTNCKEKLSIYPLSATKDSTKIQIFGEDCSGQPIIATEYIKKVNGLSSIISTVIAKTLIFVGNNVDMTISASSADNVTFLGTLSLNNENLELLSFNNTSTARRTGTATVVGFSTYSSSNSNIVRPVNNGGNYVQLKVTNFSGHLFSPADVLTFPDNVTAPQTYIRLKPASAGYEIDKFNVYVTDTFPLTQSILLGNNPSDILTTTTPYNPL